MCTFDPIAYINEPKWQESRLGLERIEELLDRMGAPQERLRFVHVAGTNGKGSICTYLAAILQRAGFRVGLFTSPYIIEFAERIRVNGENIPHDALAEATLFVREHAEAMASETGEHPTEFELMTAVAFEHFAREGCDIVVCEVGLGGRLDSTNVIAAPEASVIARIGLDHTELLGDTPAAIAREKAGIVKASSPVVSWPQEDEGAMRVIEDAAREHGCRLVVPDFSQLVASDRPDGGFRAFTYRGEAYETRMLATCQPCNAALAVETANVLRERGWDISDDDIRAGIRDAALPGRFEIMRTGEQVFVVDGAHNPQGAEILADSLNSAFGGQPIAFIIGVLADKDYRGIIRPLLVQAKSFTCVTPPSPRALPAAELADVIGEELEASGVQREDVAVNVAGDFQDAIAIACGNPGPSPVCFCGSLYSVKDAKDAIS